MSASQTETDAELGIGGVRGWGRKDRGATCLANSSSESRHLLFSHTSFLGIQLDPLLLHERTADGFAVAVQGVHLGAETCVPR